MLTVAEQRLGERAERALARLDIAKRSGDPVALASARLDAERIKAELDRVAASTGSGALSAMRRALDAPKARP